MKTCQFLYDMPHNNYLPIPTNHNHIHVLVYTRASQNNLFRK